MHRCTDAQMPRSTAAAAQMVQILKEQDRIQGSGFQDSRIPGSKSPRPSSLVGADGAIVGAGRREAQESGGWRGRTRASPKELSRDWEIIGRAVRASVPRKSNFLVPTTEPAGSCCEAVVA